MHLQGPDSGPDLGHLTYCTNIHAGEPLDEVMSSLARHLPAIKTATSGAQPLGVGLRLGHAAATSLREPGKLAELKDFLAAGGYYVFTLNGFPYGAFHGRKVKEDVYAPDWSDPHRLAYTNHLADILSELLPAGLDGSVSSVPCTYKAWASGRLAAIDDQLLRHVAHLVGIAQRTGQVISLALEPEPDCFLATIAESVSYYNEHLFSRAAVARLAGLTGLSRGAAQDALRRHIGVCYDVCHAAVEFEDASASVQQLRAAGILIAKVQLSSALRIASFDAQSARHLAAFAEPVYLHQVVQRADGELRRFVDLPQALAAADAPGGPAWGAEWRVHFHIPLHAEPVGGFESTRDHIQGAMDWLSQNPTKCQHIEMETYTWEVLPPEMRAGDVVDQLVKEYDWTLAELRERNLA